MSTFQKEVSIRWSDLDPNFHVRHSVYYDWGAQQRVEVLEQIGLTLKVMQQQGIGPILFREECVFRKEIRLNDVITIDLKVISMREDGARWSMQHTLTNQKGEHCATLTVDGAWLDVVKRKLAEPVSPFILEAMAKFPMSE